MQKFSSFERKKKQTKIRHRMVMLQHLQLINKIAQFIDNKNETTLELDLITQDM